MAQKNQRFFLSTWKLYLRDVCKGNIEGRVRGCRQSLYRGKKKTSDNAGGKPTRDFSLQHKTFSALNYAEDFGNTVKESLKRTRNSKRTNTFMVLSAVSTVSPIGANSDKRR